MNLKEEYGPLKMQNFNRDLAKRAAAKAAVNLIQDGMLVGLGTGSTASYFIENLIDRCREKHIKILCFPSSERTAKLARDGGIPLCDENLVTSLDITVDGADEVDPKKRLIKGGGGALLREKIVATMSKEMVVIIDQDKLVDKLGNFPLPIEIVPFAYHVTLNRIRQLGYDGSLRRIANDQLYHTDNGNYIVDIKFPNRCNFPEEDQKALRAIPGVIETGFFIGIAKKVIVGQYDGSVKIF
jgi:ribose 5-phosphate isomerase A